MKIRKDITGEKFGHLTAIEISGKTKSGASIWKCLCDCGNHKNIRGYHLIGKKIRSCGCLKRETVNIKWNESGIIARWVWNGYRVNAGYREILFDITVDDMMKLAEKQNFKCAMTGEDLIFVMNQKDRSKSNASLDRIDSNKGYIIGNIQWVTKNVNLMKRELSVNDFLDICKKICNYNKNADKT